MQKQNHMHDPEFEKQVRQRMEELKFSPSESVWSNLEKEITKDKSRKKPLLWFAFFLVTALAGSFYFLLTPGYNYDNTHNNSNTGKKQSTEISLQKEKLQSAAGNDHPVSMNEKKTNQVKTNTSLSAKPGEISNSLSVKNKKDTKAVIEKNIRTGNQIKQEKETLEQENVLAKNMLAKNKKGSIKNIAPVDQNNPIDDLLQKDMVADIESIAQKKHDYINDTVRTRDADAGSTIVAGKPAGLIQKSLNSDTASAGTAKVENKKSKNKEPWKIGFTGGAGISSVYESLFKTGAIADPVPYSTSISTPGISFTPSSIKAGLSFSAGFFVEKAISKKLFFSAGLTYHYYSTQIQTGDKVDSFITLNTSNAQFSTRGYYRQGETQSYTNHYHLLELPVAVAYRFNRNKNFPLFWEAGVSLAELIGSDAVHFDRQSGAYFKDNKLLNKTQFNIMTALMIGFHPGGHLYFQAGPQVQYGITNLLSASVGGKQHLFFGGIKIVFIPQKKIAGMQR